MSRQKVFAGKKKTDVQKTRWWEIALDKAKLALLASTGVVFLGIYSDALTNFIKPTVSSSWAWVQDHVSPMPDDKIIAVDLKFFIPASVNKNRAFEAVSTTLWPARCKRAEGASVISTFDDGSRDSFTNAIIKISCRASGRILIALTPQSGSTVIVYDGIFRDGDKVPFAGVPGSYYAGLLTFHLLDTKMPDGPRKPVNKCQVDHTCEEDFARKP